MLCHAPFCLRDYKYGVDVVYVFVCGNSFIAWHTFSRHSSPLKYEGGPTAESE